MHFSLRCYQSVHGCLFSSGIGKTAAFTAVANPAVS